MTVGHAIIFGADRPAERRAHADERKYPPLTSCPWVLGSGGPSTLTLTGAVA